VPTLQARLPHAGALINLPAGAPAGEPAAFLRIALPAASTVQRVTVKGFGNAPLEALLLKVPQDWAHAQYSGMLDCS